jgi:hypothetical protein
MSELVDEPAPLRSGRRLVLVATGAGVLATVGLAVVLLDPTLFGRTVLDRGAVQRDVAGQFQQREGVAVTLVCPGDMPLVTGRTYRCPGTTATGERVTVRITVTATRPPAYTWTAR